MTCYALYGLVVESEVPLPAPAVDGRTADVTVRWGGERAVSADAPDGELLLDAVVEGRRLHSLARADDGSYRYRVPPVAEVEIDVDVSEVVVHVGEEGSEGLARVLVAGAILSVVLELRGHLVLHGSGVVLGGRGVGIVGDRGMGKSTVAAMLCESGGELLTDDVLRVDLASDGGVSAARGALELRLRANADGLAARLGAAATADGRSGVRPPPASQETVPLHRIVVPSPRRGLAAPEVEELAPSDALFGLLGFPRLPGWLDPDRHARHFAQLSELVARVPVAVVRIPWSDDFDPALSAALADALG